MTKTKSQTMVLPLLPLRDVVIFPHMVIPLFVGRTESIKSLEAAMEIGKHIFLIAQKDAATDVPAEADLYSVGTVSTILQLLRLPDGTVKVLVEGAQRAKLKKLFAENDHLSAEVRTLKDGEMGDPAELEVMKRNVLVQFEQLININKKIPPELLTSLTNIEEPGRLVDSIAAHITVKINSRQKILEASDILLRFRLLHELLGQELELVEVEKRLQGRVKKQVEKSQRQYYLSEKRSIILEEFFY